MLIRVLARKTCSFKCSSGGAMHIRVGICLKAFSWLLGGQRGEYNHQVTKNKHKYENECPEMLLRAKAASTDHQNNNTKPSKTDPDQTYNVYTCPS